MAILILLVPASIGLGGFFLLAYLRAASSGQFDDLDSQSLKPFLEEK